MPAEWQCVCGDNLGAEWAATVIAPLPAVSSCTTTIIGSPVRLHHHRAV
ncbi:hypothetical protein XBO1_910004 [Xenorhabdus bovienii str. oregonense]|uniref:Uncharacterized protein n=1 Tax=Xenorhabdus bovienii str. oregonense TaxID=1398202 RepID=A0A077P143_XENBV|nr:hypothetical protein XBO1_910004 [Xenorhabdus bovienii str. oregonense]